MRRLQQRFARAAALVAVAVAASTATAEEPYPVRAVRIVAPFATGGPPDVVSRIVGARMAELLGQAFFVDNRSGAGGNVGGDAVAKAAPDGYTILMATVSTHVTNPAMYKSMPYDPVTDFEPVGLVGYVANVLVVPAGAPPRDVKGLIEYLRANPGKYNYGSSGVGSMLHLCGDLFAKVTGVTMTHVPYRGAGPMTIGLLGDEVLTGFNGITAILPQVREGTLRALAVGTPARTAALLDVPTMREAGYPGLDCYSWVALFAPAKTSPAIVAKLGDAKNQALADPAVLKRVQEVGVEPVQNGTPAQLAAFLQEQLKVWTPIIKAAGVEMD